MAKLTKAGIEKAQNIDNYDLPAVDVKAKEEVVKETFLDTPPVLEIRCKGVKGTIEHEFDYAMDKYANDRDVLSLDYRLECLSSDADDSLIAIINAVRKTLRA